MFHLFKRLQAGQFKKVNRLSFADTHQERQLEDWVQSYPELTGEELLIIGQQVPVEDWGRIDLLALDREGNTVIVELKRSKAPRELGAQINEYLAAVGQWSERELAQRVGKEPRSLIELFQKRFRISPPEAFNLYQRGIVMVEEIDDRTSMALRRLPGIKIIKFSYFKEQDEYLLVEEGKEPHPMEPAKGTAKVSFGSREGVAGETTSSNPKWQPEQLQCFLRWFGKVEPLLEKVFLPANGWRIPSRSSKDAAVTYSQWRERDQGFCVGLGYDDDEGKHLRLYIGIWVQPKVYGQGLLQILQANKKELKQKLGNSFELEDGGGCVIWEWVPEDDPQEVAKRMTIYRDELTRYLNEILPSRGSKGR